MREIVLDTETTGLDPLRGDRLVEIGCVEIFNRMPTGQDLPSLFQSRARYAGGSLCGARSLDRVSRNQAVFRRGGRRLPGFHRRCNLWSSTTPRFDIGFINAELDRIKRPAISRGSIGRHSAAWRGASIRAFPTASTTSVRAIRSIIHGAPNMARCSISELLAEVYIDLIGGAAVAIDPWRPNPRTSGYHWVTRRGGSAKPRSRRGSRMPTVRRIGNLSRPSATSRSGTTFCRLPSRQKSARLDLGRLHLRRLALHVLAIQADEVDRIQH